MVGVPRSTIGDVLRRHGLSRLRDHDRPTGVPIRYVRERPGELLHIDVKKLGRIPDGGGHRFRGRVTARPGPTAAATTTSTVAIDDMSRVAYVGVVRRRAGPDLCPASCSRRPPSSPRHGVRIERVLTDNARNYTHLARLRGGLADIGARHRRTRPYRPQTNGKAERFNGTLLAEWAYVRLYDTNPSAARGPARVHRPTTTTATPRRARRPVTR